MKKEREKIYYLNLKSQIYNLKFLSLRLLKIGGNQDYFEEKLERDFYFITTSLITFSPSASFTLSIIFSF